jgi:hypothetical protein
MSKITRENLLKQLEAVNDEIKNLEEKEYNYKTNRAWPGCMVVNTIDSVNALIKMWETIHNSIKTNSDAIKALGLDKLELVSEEDTQYYGYSFKEWEDDLKLRAIQFADTEKIKKLNKAKKILEKNMSEDDKFAQDMNAVADLIK